MGGLSGTGILLSEFIGTALLLLLGIGVGLNATLKDTFGHGRDWLLISFGWGLAVFVGASVAWNSGAKLNPAVTLALAITGAVPWDQVPWFFGAQIPGAISGAVLAYLAYKKQFDTHETRRPPVASSTPPRRRAPRLEPHDRGHRRFRARLLGPAEQAAQAGTGDPPRSSATPRSATRASRSSSSRSARRSAVPPATPSTRRATSGRASCTRCCPSAARATPNGAMPGYRSWVR